MKSKTLKIIIALVYFLFPVLVFAQSSLWYYTGGNVTPNVSSWSVKVPALSSAGTTTVVASPTGVLSICGSCGGTGNAAWTIGNGLIYNATSTDKVGVGLSSPIGQFDVFKTITIGTTPSNSITEDSGLLSTFSGGENPQYDIYSYVNLGNSKVFSATPYSDGSIVSNASYSEILTWTAVSGADGYRIFRDRNATGFFTEYFDVTSGHQLYDSDYTFHAQSAHWASTTGEAADAVPTTFNLDSLFNYNDGSTFYGLNTNGSAVVSKNFTANGSSSLTDLYLSGRFADGSNATGTKGMILQTTGTSTKWVATSTLGISSSSSGTTTLLVGNGFLNTSTSTDSIKAAFFIGTSTTATSTFINASTTNLVIIGKLLDSTNSAGTNGMLLQTTGSLTNWVSTSTLGISSGNSAWTIGNGFIYNATSTDKVGFGTTTPAYNISLSASSYPKLGIANTGTGGRTYSFTSGDTAGPSALVGSFLFKDETANAYRMTINSLGAIGLGTTSPTALVEIGAGVAAANGAPLKFSVGSKLTSIEAGVVEYDGTNFYMSPTATRKRVPVINDVTAANGNIPIGNGTDYTSAGLTGSGNLTVTNGAGSITLNTIQGITTGSAPQFARLGVGVANSALNKITIVAGTTAASQINFASGPVRTSPVAGDLTFDNGQNQIAFSNGNLQYWGGNLYTATADQTIATTTATTAFSPTQVGTTTIAANSLKVGQKITIWGAGYYTTPLANTSTVTITVSIASSTTNTISTVTTAAFPASATNLPFDFNLGCTVRATGASGSLVCDGDFKYTTALSGVAKTSNSISTVGTIPFDTTVAETLNVKGSWSAISSTQSFTVQESRIDF